MKIYHILLAIILVFLAFGGVYTSIHALSDTVIVELGKYRFEIPKYNASREGFIPEWLSNMSGLDYGSRDYLLLFSAQEISKNIPGYFDKDGDYNENIRAILSVLTNDEIERYQDPEFSYRGEAWYGTGSFKNRKVEAWDINGLYKIYREVEYPNAWTLVKLKPRTDISIPHDVFDFWVAQCRSTKSSITKSRMHTSCQTYEFFDDIVIDFNISEQNIHLVEEVRAFLKSKIIEWKK